MREGLGLYRLALVAALMAGCIAHEKAGDSAAAVGNWKSAYTSYRQALTDKPDTPGLKEKYDAARQKAQAEAQAHARSCAQTQDWSCVLTEADFLLSLDPADPEAAALKGMAATHEAMRLLAQARTDGMQGQWDKALDKIKKARALSKEPAVVQEATQVQHEVIGNALAEVERRRAARAYKEAVQLMKHLAEIDGNLREGERALEREADEYLSWQYEQHAQQGDAAMQARKWGAAHQAYSAALQVKAGGRAEGLAKYCGALAQAEAAVSAHDAVAAEAAYRAALATGLDRGEAAAGLERVRVRPYRIALRSVLALPHRPDGNPWVGPSTALFFRLSNQAATLAALGGAQAVDAAQNIPYENRPNLQVEVTFADGSRLATQPRSGIFVTYDSEFVLTGNMLDTRRITFRILLGNPTNPEEVGRVDVQVGELIARREVALRSQSVPQVVLLSEPADGRQDGSFTGFTRLEPLPGSVAASPPVQPPATGGVTVPATGTSAPPPVVIPPRPPAATPATPATPGHPQAPPPPGVRPPGPPAATPATPATPASPARPPVVLPRLPAAQPPPPPGGAATPHPATPVDPGKVSAPGNAPATPAAAQDDDDEKESGKKDKKHGKKPKKPKHRDLE